MNIGQIAGIAKSKKDKDYALTASGLALFPRTGMEPKQGQFAIYNEQVFTQDQEGKPLTVPTKINVISSLWNKKADAINALAEAKLIDVEVELTVKRATKKLEKDFSLDAVAETA